MRKTVLILIMIISFMSLTSCTYVEEEIYIEDTDKYTGVWAIPSGYKCKIVQNTDDIVIDIWYIIYKDDIVNEIERHFEDYIDNNDIKWSLDEMLEAKKMFEKDYNGTYENEYSDHRFYTLLWEYYDKEYENADKYNDKLWYEKAFEIDNFSTYTGADYKLLKSYTIDEALDKNNMPFDNTITDIQPQDIKVIHSERIHLSKEYLKADQGRLVFYIGLLCTEEGSSLIRSKETARIIIDYKIDGDTITFSKSKY